MLLGNVYRAPNFSSEATGSLLQEISSASQFKNVCIMRDFNYRNVDWINVVGDHESEEFTKVIQDNFLMQIVTEPIRGDIF